MFFLNVCLKYLFSGNYIKVPSSASLYISPTASLSNTRIYMSPGTKLYIGANVSINKALISIEKGECIIKDKCIIGSKSINKHVHIIINDGSIYVDDHAKLLSERVWIRFGGKVEIGRYTNINERSEIRCDEIVSIGCFNQISYGVKIWDTNTHTILSKEDRRKITEEKFPYFGYEVSKPKTAPVVIGNDCWIGENAAILKGTKLGNEVIVGYNSLLSGHEIEDGSTVVTQTTLKIRKRQ